jgi:hypothetical protein
MTFMVMNYHYANPFFSLSRFLAFSLSQIINPHSFRFIYTQLIAKVPEEPLEAQNLKALH